MNKCSPIEMRKALDTVKLLSDAGVEFVAMPVLNEQHKKQLLIDAMANLDTLADEDGANLSKGKVDE